MKNLLLLFIISLLSFYSYSQKATVNGNLESIKKEVSEGVFTFVLPESTVEADIKKSAEYYTDYFTVNYNGNSKVAIIKMKENTPSARRVIVRFLLSSDVKSIDFQGKEHSINDFYEKFLE